MTCCRAWCFALSRSRKSRPLVSHSLSTSAPTCVPQAVLAVYTRKSSPIQAQQSEQKHSLKAAGCLPGCGG